MYFSSLDFWLFFATFYLFFLTMRRSRLCLLLGSYVFYASFGPSFLPLLFLSTAVNYTLGLALQRSPRPSLLTLGWVLNFGTLALFKYLPPWGGTQIPISSFSFMRTEFAIPLGISFFTFQAAGYLTDVYRGNLVAERSPLNFSLFMAFFPQLVSGPIEPAGKLLPQLRALNPISLEDMESGVAKVILGLFKKLCIADALSVVVSAIFSHPDPGFGMLYLGCLSFAFQLYCDFSGYCDIAVGLGRFFGVQLSVNFHHPFSATNPWDFWQRWHMSLNRWLRDYLFIPLARSPLRPPLLLVVFFVFLVSGIWHGSTLNFLLMGAYFGGIYVSYAGMKKFLRKESLIPSSVLSRFLVIQMFVGGMVFFRSKNLPHLFSLLKSACLGPNSQTVIYDTFLHILPYVLVTIALEWLLQAPVKIRNPWRRVSVSVGLSLVLVFGYHEVQPFIYFIF